MFLRFKLFNRKLIFYFLDVLLSLLKMIDAKTTKSCVCIIIGCLIISLVLLIFISIYYLEGKYLFNPTKDVKWVPIIPYENIYVGDCNVWHFKEYDNRPVILYCHGNNLNITYREYAYHMCKGFKYNLVLFDYSGYGKSKGYPSQSKILKNGENVYKWVKERYDSKNIVVWGESLGGAVASHIASIYECRCLVLYSTFSSLDDITRKGKIYSRAMHFLVSVSSSIIGNIPTKERIKDVKDPVLVVHSVEDEVIHIQNAYSLLENVQHENKTMVTIEGTHSNPIMLPIQFLSIYKFMERNNKAFICNETVKDTLLDMRKGMF